MWGKARRVRFVPHSGGRALPHYSHSTVSNISDGWVLSSTQMQDALYNYIHMTFYHCCYVTLPELQELVNMLHLLQQML